MYVCPWFVLCETVVHDKWTNNLTLVNTLAALNAATFPALHPKFAFAARLEREGDPAGNLTMRFVREGAVGGEGQDEAVVSIKAEATPAHVQFFHNFQAGIRLLAPGPVRFRVEVREGRGKWYAVGGAAVGGGPGHRGRDSLTI